MASDFVRNIKGVKNIDILSPNITTENDLISTRDGEVYVVTNKGYRKITNIETKDFESLKNQSDTNTLNISNLTDDIESLTTTTETNTSDISNLKTTTETNTSDISNLKTTTETNTSDIESLKTSTETNTSDISNLKTSTESNTSDIETLNTTTSDNTTNIDSANTLIEQLQQQLNDLKAKSKQYYTLFEGSANGVGTKINISDDFYSFDMIYIAGGFPGGSYNEPILIKGLQENIVIHRINLRNSDGVFLGAYELELTINNEKELEIINDVSWDEGSSTGSGAERNAFTITNIEGVK